MCVPPLVFHTGNSVAGGTGGNPGHITITPIYWAPTGYSWPTNYRAIVNGYIANVAADSRRATNVFSVGTQYYQQLATQPIQRIQYVVSAGVAIDDPSAYPAQHSAGNLSGCDATPGGSLTACVADFDLQAEILAVVQAHALPIDDGHMYVAFFPNNVQTCDGPPSTTQACSNKNPGYCAYHSDFAVSTSNLLYANEPYPDLKGCSPQEGAQAPNGDVEADAVISTLSHEANETITDWHGAWTDSANPYNENGDLCAYVYGQSLGGTSVAFNLYNQVINGAHYYTQDEFSNGDFALNLGDVVSDHFPTLVSGCVQQEELPTAGFTFPTIVSGSPATFNGATSTDADSTSPLSYVWSWGDLTANGTGASPSHTYSAAGTFSVALTVTDIDGWVGSVTQLVNVSATATVPGAPTTVHATAGDSQASLTWTAPASTGGAPIIGYSVTPFIGLIAQGARLTGSTGNSFTAIGLSNGTTYTFTVAAINAAGTGAASAPSNAVTPAAAVTVPGAPSGVVATAGVGSATLTWTPPASNGGSPITKYTVTTLPSVPAVVVTLAQAVVPGLSPGTSYSFTVVATNAAGPGPASGASNSVSPLAGGTYHPLVPARILDTRAGVGVPVRAAGPLGAGQSLDLQVTGQGQVPGAGVSSVILNVTVTNTTAPGFLSVWPQGTPLPLVSNLNWVAGKTIANLVEVAVGPTGMVSFYNSGGNTDVIVDVQGYVGDNTDSYNRAGLFNPLPPERILDTRTTIGGHNARLSPGETLTLTVTGPTGAPPADVSAVVLNVTAVYPTAAGFLTVWPTGAMLPTASNLNFQPGQVVPNRVMVGVGPGGQVSIYNPGGTVDVVADINGWFTSASSPAGGSAFIGILPTRIHDTRVAPPSLGPGGILTLGPVTGGSPTALVLNVTAVAPTSAGFLSLYPDNPADPYRTPPTASDLNFVAGDVVPNLTVVKLGSNAKFDTFNPGGSVSVVYDEDGYYGAVTVPPA
jgi:PKD domain/Fibronectin type III domain